MSPTFNSDVKPTSTGLALGNSNQKWIAYVSNLFADVIQSNTPNQASTGNIRLASVDTIAWRNAANTADVVLSKTNAAATTTPADTLVFSGSGIEGPFLSHNLNPASVGELRLSGADVIYFRNQANSGDIAGLAHNSDDTVTVGGAAGASSASLSAALVTAGTVAGTTSLTLQSGSGTGGFVSINSANGPSGGIMALLAGSATTGGGTGGSIGLSSGNGNTSGAAGPINLTTGNGGLTSNGGAVTITTGNGGGTSGNSGSIALNTGSVVSGTKGTISTNTTVSNYNGIATVGSGIPAQVATVDLTAQTAAITATTLYTPTATGLFRVIAYLKITTAGTSPIVGPVTIAYTDGTDSVAQSVIMSCQTQAGVAQATGNSGNTTTSVLTGTLAIWAKTGVAITYAIALTGTVGAGQYEAHLRLESM